MKQKTYQYKHTNDLRGKKLEILIKNLVDESAKKCDLYNSCSHISVRGIALSLLRNNLIKSISHPDVT
jgi:hypothetical protein